jgi:hypothetical protein
VDILVSSVEIRVYILVSLVVLLTSSDWVHYCFPRILYCFQRWIYLYKFHRVVILVFSVGVLVFLMDMLRSSVDYLFPWCFVWLHRIGCIIGFLGSYTAFSCGYTGFIVGFMLVSSVVY